MSAVGFEPRIGLARKTVGQMGEEQVRGQGQQQTCRLADLQTRCCCNAKFKLSTEGRRPAQGQAHIRDRHSIMGSVLGLGVPWSDVCFMNTIIRLRAGEWVPGHPLPTSGQIPLSSAA